MRDTNPPRGRYDGEHRRPQEYRSGSGYAGSGRYGGESGDDRNRNRTEGGYRPRERRHTSSEAKVVALTVPVTAGTVTILGLIRPTVVRRDRPAKGQRGANPTIPISMSTTGRLAGTVTTPPAIRRGASAGAADTADRKAVSRGGSRYGNDRSQEGRPGVMPRGTVTAKARNRESMPAVGRMAAARAANGVMATASVLTANAVRGTGKGTAANLTELRAAVLTAVDRPTGVVRPVSGAPKCPSTIRRTIRLFRRRLSRIRYGSTVISPCRVSARAVKRMNSSSRVWFRSTDWS